MSRVRTARYAAYVLLLVSTGVLVFAWWEDLVRAWSGQPWTFVAAMIGMAGGTWLQALNFRSFLPGRAGLTLSPLVRVWAAGSLANYLGPFQPGLALRVLWLRRYEISMSDSLAASWRQVSASVWISLAGAAAGLLMLDASRHVLTASLLVAVFALAWTLHGPLFTWISRLQAPVWLARRRAWVGALAGGYSRQGLCGVVLQYFVATLLILYVYRRFGVDIHPAYAVLMACAVYVSSLVAVLPGNFGVLEGIYVAGGYALGLDVRESTALALFLRGAHIASCLALLWLPGGKADAAGPEAGAG